MMTTKVQIETLVRKLAFVLSLAAILLTSSCSRQVPSCLEPVNIPDKNLEAAIREALDKPHGNLGCADMERLTVLEATLRDIESLEGLQVAVNLRILKLDLNPFSDISPLQHLTRLEQLSLSKKALSPITISDLTPLRNLTSLTHLSLAFNRLNDLSPLQNLTNLTFLDLVVNNVGDLTPLQNLTKLTVLVLSYNNISDIRPLGNLTNLARLYLGENSISDLTPLQNLTNLRDLHFRFNNISDLTGLENSINLTYLDLAFNNISDITLLVNNLGLGAGDQVLLYDNPLANCDGVYALRHRGVVVDSDRCLVDEEG